MKLTKMNAVLQAIVCGTISLSFAPQLHGQVFTDQYGGVPQTGDVIQEIPAQILPMGEVEIPGSAYYVGPDGQAIADPQQVPNLDIPSGSIASPSVIQETIVAEDPIYDGKEVFPLGTFPTQEFGEKIISQTKVDENGKTVEISGTLEAESQANSKIDQDIDSSGLENGIPVDEVVRPDDNADQAVASSDPVNDDDGALSVAGEAPGMSVVNDGSMAEDKADSDKLSESNKSLDSENIDTLDESSESSVAKEFDKVAGIDKSKDSKDVKALRAALLKLDTRHDRLKNRLKEANNAIKKLESDLESAKNLTTKAQSESEAAKTKLAELDKDQSKEGSNAAGLKKDVDRLNKELVAAKKSLTEAENKLAQQTSSESKLSEEMAKMLSAKESANEGIAKLKKDSAAERTKLKKQVKELKSELKNAKSEVDGKLEKSNKQISELKKELKSAQSKAAKSIDEKEKRIAQQDEKLKKLNQQLATAESKLKEETKQSAKAAGLAEKKQKEELKSIQKQLQELEDQLEKEQLAAKEELEQLKKEKMAAQKSADQSATALAQLKTKIKDTSKADASKDETVAADESTDDDGEMDVIPNKSQLPEVADEQTPKVEATSPQASDKSEAELAREKRAAAEAAVKRRLAELEAEAKKKSGQTGDAVEMDKAADNDNASENTEVDGTLEVVPAALTLDDRIKLLKDKRDELTKEAAAKIREKQQADIDQLIADGASEDSDAVVAAKKELSDAIENSKEKLKARYRRKIEKLKRLMREEADE